MSWKAMTMHNIMKNVGAVFVVVGFVVWFGQVMAPYNIIGLPLLAMGAILYFIGRKHAKA